MYDRSAITKLREGNSCIKVIGSYNAYFNLGNKLKTIFTTGYPAIIDYNDECIVIKAFPRNSSKESILEYSKEDTEILWVGNSGRLKDYFTWLLIRNNDTSSLVSNFVGECEQSTDRYASELFYKLADLGYKTGVERKTRGLIGNLVITISFSIYLIVTGHIPLSILLFALLIGLILFETFTKKGPPARKGR